MFIIIQQIKSHNLESGIVQEPDFLNEVICSLIHPGIFGVVLLFVVVVGNLVKFFDKDEEGK